MLLAKEVELLQDDQRPRQHHEEEDDAHDCLNQDHGKLRAPDVPVADLPPLLALGRRDVLCHLADHRDSLDHDNREAQPRRRTRAAPLFGRPRRYTSWKASWAASSTLITSPMVQT